MEKGVSESDEGKYLMNALSEFLTLIAETAEQNCDLKYPISLKELKKEGGIYAELGEGFADVRYYDKKEIRTVSVLFLCRDGDQSKCMGQLESISMYISRLKKYPEASSFCWLDAEIAKQPSKIGRDEDGTYHYSCILNCKLYY